MLTNLYPSLSSLYQIIIQVLKNVFANNRAAVGACLFWLKVQSHKNYNAGFKNKTQQGD